MSAANEHSKSTNPLPDGVAGPGLLVDLMTERAIAKCGIKENWEEPGGWEYEDLRAIVACALGEDYSTDQDRERMVVVEKRTRKSLMKEIRAFGAPPLFKQDGESPTAEAYYTVLILGMFDKTNPIYRGKYDESSTMADEFSKLMGTDEPNRKKKPFQHPKKVVKECYKDYLARKKQRDGFRGKLSTRKTTGYKLNQEQAFQLVIRELGRRKIPGFDLTPERRAEVAGFLLKLGIRSSR